MKVIVNGTDNHKENFSYIINDVKTITTENGYPLIVTTEGVQYDYKEAVEQGYKYTLEVQC